MPISTKSKLVILIVIVGLLVATFAAFFLLWLDQKLLWERGWGLISRPLPPYLPALATLYRLEGLFTQQLEAYYQEKDDLSGYKWPDANTVAAQLPELVVFESQPYAHLGIYILKSQRTRQEFLYSPDDILSPPQLGRIAHELLARKSVHASPVVMCVKAMSQRSPGIYCAYHDYPLRYSRMFEFQEWQKWYLVIRNPCVVSFVQSDIPPIPGCLARISVENRKLAEFYYPERIVPVFKTIYPNVSIDEAQILREGRDY